MISQVIKKSLCIFILIITIFSVNVNFGHNYYFYFVPTVILFQDIYLIIYTRKNKCLMFLFLCLFYFNYSIVFGLYYQRLSSYEFLFKMLPERTWELSISYCLLFQSIVVCFLKKPQCNTKIILLKNEIVYYLSFSYLLINSFLLIITNNLLFSKLNEYSIVFILLGITSTDKKNLKFMFLLPILLCCFADLKQEGRVQMIQFLLIPALVYIIPKLKARTIIFCALFGIVLFTYVGLLGDYSYSKIISIDDFILIIKTRQFTNDTSVFAYYTSACFVDDIKLYTLSERMYYFLCYNYYNIVGGEIMQLCNISRDLYNLPSLAHINHLHWYGGVIFNYFAFYLGTFGVIMIAIFTTMLINLSFINKKNKYFNYILFIFICSTVFRWYLYAPWIRNLFVLIYCYSLIKILSNTFKTKGNR